MDEGPANRRFLKEYGDLDQKRESRYQALVPVPPKAEDFIVEYVRETDKLVRAEEMLNFQGERLLGPIGVPETPFWYLGTIKQNLPNNNNQPVVGYPIIRAASGGVVKHSPDLVTYAVDQPIGAVKDFYLTMQQLSPPDPEVAWFWDNREDGQRFRPDTDPGMEEGGLGRRIAMKENPPSSNIWVVEDQSVSSYPDGTYQVACFDTSTGAGSRGAAHPKRITVTTGLPQPLIGQCKLDENTGGTDNLAYRTASGIGISGASVYVYTNQEWVVHRLDNPVGTTLTNSEGRWVNAMIVDPGTYQVVFHLPGRYGPDSYSVAVDAQTR